jgi:hypothetical protein
MDASKISFQLYSSGVYYEPACSQTNLNHGIENTYQLNKKKSLNCRII